MSRRLLRRLRRFGGWGATIVGGVIASVVAYHLTKEPAAKPAPPPVTSEDSAAQIAERTDVAKPMAPQITTPSNNPAAIADEASLPQQAEPPPTRSPAPQLVKPPPEAPEAAAPCVARIVAVDGASEIPAAGADVVLRRGNRQCIKGSGSRPISVTVEVCGGRVAPSPEFLVGQNAGGVEFAYTAWVAAGGPYRQVAFEDDQYRAATIRPRADAAHVRMSFALEQSVPAWEICELVPGDY